MLGGTSLPDPYLDKLFVGQSGFQDTKGKTPKSFTINPNIKNLVLIHAGQSNAMNILPSIVTPVHSSQIDNLNIYDGGLYSTSSGPLLGTQSNGGSVSTAVAELLIANSKWGRVILAPVGISGSDVAEWSSIGPLYTKVPIVMRRLAARGITPSTPGVTFAILWMQGEADGAGGTSTVNYEAFWNSFYSGAVASGFSGRTFITSETYELGVSYSSIRTAQANLRNGVTIFNGGDLDTIGSSGRYDDIHFNDTGGPIAASLIYNAMLNSGGIFA